MLIYSVKNVINGKRYVGQTVRSIEKRWYHHCYKAENGSNNFIHNAIRKYGHNSFEIEILENINDIELLNERETYWINFYDTFRNGYNMTSGGGNGRMILTQTRQKMSLSRTGQKRTDQTKKKMQKSWENRKIKYPSKMEEKIKEEINTYIISLLI